MEITADVGYFEYGIVKSIRIGKNEVALNNDSYAEFKMKVPRAAGRYQIPVEISFEDPNGNQVTVSKTVTYSVVELLANAFTGSWMTILI